MMYRNFAIATLLGAPLIVMAVQSFTPQPQHPASPEPATTDAPATPATPAPAAYEAPAASDPAPVDPAPFGTPMADAGKPMVELPGSSADDALTPQVDGQ